MYFFVALMDLVFIFKNTYNEAVVVISSVFSFHVYSQFMQ